MGDNNNWIIEWIDAVYGRQAMFQKSHIALNVFKHRLRARHSEISIDELEAMKSKESSSHISGIGRFTIDGIKEYIKHRRVAAGRGWDVDVQQWALQFVERWKRGIEEAKKQKADANKVAYEMKRYNEKQKKKKKKKKINNNKHIKFKNISSYKSIQFLGSSVNGNSIQSMKTLEECSSGNTSKKKTALTVKQKQKVVSTLFTEGV